MRSFPGNPYDGHSLKAALEQVAILTDQRPDLAVVDRGYRGHAETRTRPLCQGSCPLLYFYSISQVGGIGR
jgi:IS5 family transposase